MTTLITIPSVTAYHIPAPGVSPVNLASGDLTLLLIPAQPPNHLQPSLTLSIGNSASFPLSERTPLHAVDTNREHASYVFTPLLPASPNSGKKPHDGSTTQTTYGKVKLVMKECKSVSEHEACESSEAKFVEVLKEHKVWKDMSFYDEEDEADEASAASANDLASIGATLAHQLSSYGSYLAERLNKLTDRHVASQEPGNVKPSEQTKDIASAFSTGTATLASYTHAAAESLSHAVQEGAKVVGGYVRETVESLEGSSVTEGATNAENGPNQTGPFRAEIKETAQHAKEVGVEAWDEVSLAVGGAAEG